MRKSKLSVTLIVIALITLLPLSAAEGDWYDGKTITRIDFTGLRNVKESTADALVKGYVGKAFSDELYSELDSTLYAQSWMNYMLVDAIEDETDENGLVLSIAVYENPMIASVEFEGNSKINRSTLSSAQTLIKGSFYSSNNINANVQLIKDHYLSKGYNDADVKGDVTEDEETNTVTVTYTISEGKQYKVRQILFEGNSALTSKELKNLLSTKEKSFFNAGNYVESTLTSDESTILSYYATKGYPDAAIKEVRKEEIEDETTDTTVYLNITFVLEEGELWSIGSVTVTGNVTFTDEEIGALVTIESGDIYNSEKIESVYSSIAMKYYDNGYVYSSITPSLVEKDGNIVDVTFSIVEGPQTVIEEIRINGLEKTKPYVLEREMDIRVGDVFSRSAFIQSQQNMYNTSLLKNITANIYPGTTENGVICEFTVEEANTMELQFGATFGASEVDGFPVSGFLSLSNSNLGGTGRSLTLSTELSPTTQALSLSLSDSWVGDARWSNAVSISVARNVRSNTLQRGIGSAYYDGRDDSESTYPLGYNSAYEWYSSGQMTPSSSSLMKYDNYSFTVGYSSGYSWVFGAGTLSASGGFSVGLNRAVYDENKYDPYEYLIKKYREKWQFSNKLSATLTWDARNYVSTTPHGYVATLQYTYAGGFLGGLSNYNKLSLNLSMYTGIWRFENKEKGTAKNLILGFTSEVDFMLPQFWNKDNTGWSWHDAKDGATKYEMLYIDGMNIGRGFSVQTDKSFLWNNQIDLTYPLAEDVLSLEAFVSGTAVKTRLDNLSFSSLDWYMAAGFGIKMEIPGFPLGLYLVKNATIMSGESFTWIKGPLFSSGDKGGLSLVLAITTSIY